MFSRLSLVASIALLAACHGSSSDPFSFSTQTTSLGFAADSVTLQDGVMAAREFEDGDDKNGDGDGDLFDQVFHRGE